jgi:tryptophan-rich sensory protein
MDNLICHDGNCPIPYLKEDTSRELKAIAFILFGVQLLLIFLSFIFFKLEPGWAFAEMFVPLTAILACIFAFGQVNKQRPGCGSLYQLGQFCQYFK